MKKLVLFFVGLFLATNFLFAQSQTLSWALTPDNKGNIVCPNTQQIYSAYVKDLPANYGFGCKFQWRVENGYFPLYGNATTANTQTISRIDVVFNNNGNTARLFLSTTGCDSTKSNTQGEKPFDVFLRTLSTETPVANGTYPLQVQKGSRTVAFNVNRLQIPNTGQNGDVSGITSSLYADAYKWTLPSDRPNWYFEGFATSKRDHTTSGTSVNVVVDALNAGTVSVQGVVTVCTPNNFSKTLALPIVRTTPTVGAISSIEQAGKVNNAGVLECGVTDTLIFRTSLASGLSARNYQWRFTENAAGYKFVRANGVLKDTAMTTESSVKVLVVANKTATLSVLANINYGNNVFENSNPSSLTTRINTVTPNLSLAADKTAMCSDSETEQVLVKLSATGGIGFRYSYINNSPSVVKVEQGNAANEYVVKPIGLGVSGDGSVSFRVTNSCGLTSTQTFNITVSSGRPGRLGRLYTNEREPFCLGREKTFWIDEVPNATSYEWRTPPKSTTVITYYGTRAEILVRNYGTHDFAIIARNGCDSVVRTYRIAVTMPSSDDAPCMLRVGINVEIMPITAAVIFPNPVDSELKINLPAIYSTDLQAFIYDGLGQLRKTVNMKQCLNLETSQLSISVADLPLGTYFLHLIDSETVSQHRVLISR